MSQRRPSSIKRKMTLVMLFTCAIVLLVAVVSLCSFQLVNMSQNFKRDLAIIGEITANNCAAAVEFNSDSDAREMIAALRAEPFIVAAWVRKADGHDFVQYGPPNNILLNARLPLNGQWVEGDAGHLYQATKIMLKQERVGTLYLCADYETVYSDLLWQYGRITACIFLISILLGLLLSSRLQRVITEPVVRLARTARTVAEKRDYSVRAEKMEDDELGLFTDAFNQMLSQIQTQDGALHQARQNLQVQVEALQHEITVRNRAEEALISSERQYRTTIDSMSDAIFVLDEHFHIELANHGCNLVCEKLQLPFVHAGQELFAAFPFLNHAIRAEYEQVFRTGRPLITSERHQFRKHEIATETRKIPILENGRAVRIITVLRDVTEQRQLEAQFLRAQRLDSLGTLSSGIAHDLNNVLAPILMSAPLLRDHVQNEDGQAILTAIESSSRRGADIVRQLLVFGRGVDVERMPLNPRHLVREMVKIAQETFPKNLHIISEVPQDLCQVKANATQLHQVLMNLCVNSRDAMAARGGTLTISAANIRIDEEFAQRTPGAKPGDYVLLKVADTGSGIPPELLDKIFEPFFTTKEVGKGTGLGLSTVLGIIKGHGGFVEVQSQPGNGSEFRAYFPAIPSTAETHPAELVTKWPEGQGEHILIVDDESAVRQSLQKILELHGYNVLVAADGAEGVAVYTAHRKKIKAVITDLAMPAMDGLAMTRVLKRLEADLRIIVSTGLGHEEQVTALKSLGIETILNKPFSVGSLLTALHNLLTAEP